MSSSSGSSPQWTSSKTSTSGLSAASCSAHARAAHVISCWLRSASTASSTPTASASRSATASSSQHSRIFSLRLVERVVVGDPGRRLHHLGERPVRDALAVGKAAAGEDGRALETGDELAREPALADAGVAVDRDERGAPVADAARERVLEQLELGVAADERRGERAQRPAAVLDGADDAVGGDRRGRSPAARRGSRRLELDPALDEARRAGADEDLARLRLLLEPRGDVHRLARGERRVPLLLGDDLARLDADAGLEVERPHPLERGEAGADGALGVVLVRERDPEGGHDGVAGELLHRAAVRDDAVRDLVEEARDAAPDDLRIDAGEQLRRVDEVDEQHGCELPLHTPHGTWAPPG